MSIVNESEQLSKKFGLLSVHAVFYCDVASFSEWKYKRKLNSFMNSQEEQLF